MRWGVLSAWAVLGIGCGYHVAGASGDPLGPFVVTGGEARTPYAEVMAAAEEGARRELSRQGALASGGPDRTALVVEILRVDEISEAPAITASAQGPIPLARAVRISVVGRAVLEREGAVVRDTGDVRAASVIARAGDPTTGLLTRDAAAERAARRLGALLARRLLGFPEPGDP